MACSDIASGTELYMSLYPKDSTDGGTECSTFDYFLTHCYPFLVFFLDPVPTVIRLGNIVP
jgi:hypothetical protein